MTTLSFTGTTSLQTDSSTLTLQRDAFGFGVTSYEHGTVVLDPNTSDFQLASNAKFVLLKSAAKIAVKLDNVTNPAIKGTYFFLMLTDNKAIYISNPSTTDKVTVNYILGA